VLSIFTSISPTIVKGESLEEQLRRIDREREQLRGEIDNLQENINTNKFVQQGYSDQASKLYNEIEIFQKEIDQLHLEVEELEINIQLVEQDIKSKNEEIEKNKKGISQLERESRSRITDNYKSFRLNGGGEINSNNIFTTEDINDYFVDTQYISIIQEDTNSLMTELARLKRELEVKKLELDEKKKELVKGLESLEIKRSDLSKQRDEIQVKMNVYYAEISAIQNQINNAEGSIAVFSQEEAEKAAQAERIRQEIFNSYTPVTVGEYVAGGRPIGNQGCTGLCTGPHLHFSVQQDGAWQEPCSYLPGGGPVGGCGGSGILPNWPISGTVYFTSGYGNRCFNWGGSDYCDFHSGIDLAGVPSNTPIFAAHSGYAYKGVDPYGAMYVVICEVQGCRSGIKTGYWHLSAF